MIVPSSLGYRYAVQFSARKRPYCGQCVFSEIVLFTVPLSDASAFRAFLGLIFKEISEDVRDDVARHADYLPLDGWVFAILENRGANVQNFRTFGVSSIGSSVAFLHVFYRQFRGLDDFGFYDSYTPAPIVL